MNIFKREEYIMLFIGDIIVLFGSLFLTISIRYSQLPTSSMMISHIEPFSILFIAFVLVYFIAGLYEKHTGIFKKRLPLILLNVQLINTIVGIAFFYFIPGFSIAPKFVLFLFLLLSLALMYAWRMFFVFRFNKLKNIDNVEKAILIADSKESKELENEVNSNSRYNISFVKITTLNSSDAEILKEIKSIVSSNNISQIVLDTNDKRFSNLIPLLYPLAMNGILFYDIGKVYENIFDRIPVSMVGQTWFIEHMSSMAPKLVYDGFKRLIDIVCSLILGIISLIIYPFVYIAMKIEDSGGVIFSYQNRVGQYNKVIKIVKFRTMTIANDEGKWGNVANIVTRVGFFLRKTRIDELPQLWNVLKGDISLIGPRPEFPEPVEKYSLSIPNYTIRHSVKPGLSGWAQIYHENHPHHGIDIEETSNKLSYDLYYIKHRSIFLDIKIALRTIKILFIFAGR